MGNKPPKDEGTGKVRRDRRAERETRLAEALRANLRRRKAQERGRSGGEAAGGDSGAGNQDGAAPERSRE